MRLLIITQKVDKKDPVLGFFHNWLEKLSQKFEEISVICLEKGEFDLPNNVKIFSLGKESGRSKIKYINNFLNLILGLHKNYNSVLVHMNQEYILLGGFFWKIMRKKIYFWRNHQYGNLLTRIAVWFSNKVFCTSKFAFVAKYKKTKLMPVGIDTDVFNRTTNNQILTSKKEKILFLGRMDPIKKPDLLIQALGVLNKKNQTFKADFFGNPSPKNEDYFSSLGVKIKNFSLENIINFYKEVPNYETPKIYKEHEIFVNLTPTGSFDKTILEAAACGCILVTTNQTLSGEIDERMIVKENPEDIANSIKFWLNIDNKEKEIASEKLYGYVLKNHSLDALTNSLIKLIN